MQVNILVSHSGALLFFVAMWTLKLAFLSSVSGTTVSALYDHQQGCWLKCEKGLVALPVGLWYERLLVIPPLA